MHRSELRHFSVIGLCAAVLLSACAGDGKRERDDAATAQDDDHAEHQDGSAEHDDGGLDPDDDAAVAAEAGASDASIVRMDGGGGSVDAAMSLDARSNAPSDASGDALRGMEEPLDGSALGPVQFPGPPFAAPERPVQRLALDTGEGVCVVLEDRTLYCVLNYSDAARRKSFTHNVPDNRDFVKVIMIGDDGNLFFALRSDDSIAVFTSSVEGSRWGTAGEKYIGAFGNTSTPCVLRSSGEVTCTNGAALPRYPAGPYIQFTGSISNLSNPYAGVRADGALVSGPTADGGALVFHDEVFIGYDMQQAPSFCAIAKSGSVYCSRGSGSLMTLVRQPYSDVRDVAIGLLHVCAVAGDGTATCSYNGGTSDSKIPADQRFVDIETALQANTCGVNESGELWCWGTQSNSIVQVPLPKKAAVQ